MKEVKITLKIFFRHFANICQRRQKRLIQLTKRKMQFDVTLTFLATSQHKMKWKKKRWGLTSMSNFAMSNFAMSKYNDKNIVDNAKNVLNNKNKILSYLKN